MISASEEATSAVGRPRNNRQTLVQHNGRAVPHLVNAATVKADAKGQFWINFMHLGRKYYSLMLWASTALSQRKWLENIVKQQQTMRERSMIFDTYPLSEGFFSGPNKVNCAAPYSSSLFCCRLVRVAHTLGRWWPSSGLWHG